MTLSAQQEIARLQPLTAAELHGKYQELFGESPRSRHKAYLVRRIACDQRRAWAELKREAVPADQPEL